MIQLDDMVQQQINNPDKEIFSQVLLQKVKNFLSLYKNTFKDLQQQLKQAVDNQSAKNQIGNSSKQQQIAVATSTYNMFANNMKQSEEQFAEQASHHVKNIKQQMRELNQNIEEGKLEGDQLQKDIRDNKERQKQANSSVDRAQKYMSKNKSCVFLTITVLDTVGLILVFMLC